MIENPEAKVHGAKPQSWCQPRSLQEAKMLAKRLQNPNTAPDKHKEGAACYVCGTEDITHPDLMWVCINCYRKRPKKDHLSTPKPYNRSGTPCEICRILPTIAKCWPFLMVRVNVLRCDMCAYRNVRDELLHPLETQTYAMRRARRKYGQNPDDILAITGKPYDDFSVM